MFCLLVITQDRKLLEENIWSEKGHLTWSKAR